MGTMQNLITKLRLFLTGIVSSMMGFRSVTAQDLGHLEGTVYYVTDATVTLVGLNYSQRANEFERFVFEEAFGESDLLDRRGQDSTRFY